MKHVLTMNRNLRRDVRGVTAIEYGLLVALIIIACIAALSLTGKNAKATFTDIASSLVSYPKFTETAYSYNECQSGEDFYGNGTNKVNVYTGTSSCPAGINSFHQMQFVGSGITAPGIGGFGTKGSFNIPSGDKFSIFDPSLVNEDWQVSNGSGVDQTTIDVAKSACTADGGAFYHNTGSAWCAGIPNYSYTSFAANYPGL